MPSYRASWNIVPLGGKKLDGLTDAERTKILALLRKHLAMKERVRYIPEEPAKKPDVPPSAEAEKVAQ